jgi:NhaP-type Na+/H+ or K+/H+ antiporter
MQSPGEIATVFVREIGLAILVGIAIGWAGAWVVRRSSERGWMAREGRQVVVAFLALLCYLLADTADGSGFIAAFVGGIVFGHLVRRTYPEICHFSEGVAHLMTMFAFFVFGGLILAPALESITVRYVVYALLSLTVVRMVPVAVSLLGTGLARETQLYIGWFGPRGLASLVFIGTVVVEAAPEDSREIIAVGATAVALSVLLHGLSAWPASQRYASWWARRSEKSREPAMVEAQELDHVPAPWMQGRLGRVGGHYPENPYPENPGS